MIHVNHWVWILAGLFGAGAGIGFLLNPVLMLQLCRSIGGWILETGKAAVEWLRRQHNWWRIGCLAMSLLFATASCMVWADKQTLLAEQTAAAAKAAADAAEISRIQRENVAIVDAVNKEADRRIAEAKKHAADALRAQKAAEALSARLKAKNAAFAKRLTAASKRPECKALLDSDLGTTCGL
jgi:hypothetical protein